MRVLLLQLDGKLPNVALMRIAAHHRAHGDSVEFRNARTVGAVERQLWDLHDRVYASLIFTSTRPVAEQLQRVRPGAIIGGTGWDLSTTLEQHGVSTTKQDYSLYPKFRASIGFTQRGCRLRCGFCVVPKKEGAVRPEQRINELWRGDPWPRDLLLLDNDFFGLPAWRDRIEEIRAGNFRVSFSQGINARMLDDETAAAIASVRYYDDNFKARRIYTAWDNAKDEHRLFEGLEALKRHGVRPQQIMVYMLIGYQPGETHDERDHRRRKLREWGARPYPMPFIRTPELVAFQRWVLGRGTDKTIPWADFVRARASLRRAAEQHHRRKYQLPLISNG